MVCGLQQEVHFAQKATVCKYLVPQAYPEPSQGDAWARFDADILAQEGVEVIYAGARQDGTITRPTGSRFAAILAVRDDRVEAEAAVERVIARLESDGLRHRQDIATPELVNRRVQHMQSVLKQ
jgi:phosphoribosylamine--glycine ligase